MIDLMFAFLFFASCFACSTMEIIKDNLIPKHSRSNKKNISITRTVINLAEQSPLDWNAIMMKKMKIRKQNESGELEETENMETMETINSSLLENIKLFSIAPWYKINLSLNEHLEITLNYTIPLMVNIVDGYCHHPLYTFTNRIKKIESNKNEKGTEAAIHANNANKKKKENNENNDCFHHHALLSINSIPQSFDNPIEALASGKCASTIHDGKSIGNGLCSPFDPFSHKFNPIRLSLVYPKIKEFDGIENENQIQTGETGIPQKTNIKSEIPSNDSIKEFQGGYVFLQVVPYSRYECQMEWNGIKFNLVQPWYHHEIYSLSSNGKEGGISPKEKCQLVGMKPFNIETITTNSNIDNQENEIKASNSILSNQNMTLFYKSVGRLISKCPYLRESRKAIITTTEKIVIIKQKDDQNINQDNESGNNNNNKDSNQSNENEIQKIEKCLLIGENGKITQDNIPSIKECNQLLLPCLCQNPF